MKQKILLRLLPTLAIGALAAGCGGRQTPGSSAGGSGAAGAVTSVTIGDNPTIVQPQPLVGVFDGEYARQMPGIAFTSKEFGAGPAVLEALRAGVVDIACSGPYPALKAYAKDRDIVLLCGTAVGGTELMVAKNSPYKSIKDLKGKLIGVNQIGSTVEALVRHNLLLAGFDPDKDVKLVKVDPGDQAAALQAGQVDAVAAPAPWPSQVALQGNGRPLIDWKQILDNGQYLSGSLYTTRKFAEAHPDFIKRFVAANTAITKQLNADPAEADAQVLAAWSKVSHKTLAPAVAKDAFSTIRFTTDADPKGLQEFADIAYQVGTLRHKADLTGFVYGTR